MRKEFGQFLKKLREDRKMTLRDVEQKAGISNAYLSQVENGLRSTPTLKVLSRLAKAYGVSVQMLAEQAEAALKKQGIDNTTLPAPDVSFICRGYEQLSEENKRALKKYLEFLQGEQNKL